MAVSLVKIGQRMQTLTVLFYLLSVTALAHKSGQFLQLCFVLQSKRFIFSMQLSMISWKVTFITASTPK